MQIEYEATFTDIDKSDIIEKLQAADATQKRAEFLQRRIVLDLPAEKRDPNTWMRVRDEGGTVTLTLKSVDGTAIDGQKEILVEVKHFENTVALLEAIGCERTSYQESKRELWMLGNVEIAIDTWPFLAPVIEIEGPSEAAVKAAAEALGLDYNEAIFDTVNAVYKQTYGKTINDLDADAKRNITFDGTNPFA